MAGAGTCEREACGSQSRRAAHKRAAVWAAPHSKVHTCPAPSCPGAPVHLKPSTQPPQAQSGQGQQELQVASGTASPKALGYVGDACAAGGCCAGFERARCLCMGLWGRAGLTVRRSTRCFTVTPPRKEVLLTCGKKKYSCHGSRTGSK